MKRLALTVALALASLAVAANPAHADSPSAGTGSGPASLICQPPGPQPVPSCDLTSEGTFMTTSGQTMGYALDVIYHPPEPLHPPQPCVTITSASLIVGPATAALFSSQSTAGTVCAVSPGLVHVGVLFPAGSGMCSLLLGQYSQTAGTTAGRFQFVLHPPNPC